MRSPHWMSTRTSRGIALALALAFSGALTGFVGKDKGAAVTPPASAKLEATIFSYDGQDFVRTKTTLATEKGKSAVNTKLEHDNPAYKALMQKRSYTGDATLFGKQYEANYAPLTGEDGNLTGALFVAVGK